MYIPDPIELGEMRAERWEAEMHVRGSIYRCGCGKEFGINDGDTISADPWAAPVCPDCFEKWIQDNGGWEKINAH